MKEQYTIPIMEKKRSIHSKKIIEFPKEAQDDLNTLEMLIVSFALKIAKTVSVKPMENETEINYYKEA